MTAAIGETVSERQDRGSNKESMKESEEIKM
jgi:hypothetical protein